MTTSVHANLTGSDLHEPKGAATALSGEVYVSDGAGSGVWTPASVVITNSAFTTGDTKLTFKTSADTGWIIPANGGTIGDGSSSATIRANADTAALFALLWNNVSSLAVSGGRGASAAADYAAHKTIQLPGMPSRAIGIAGSGDAGTIGLGTNAGVTTVTLTQTNLPAATLSGSASGSITGTANPASVFGSGGASAGGGLAVLEISGGSVAAMPVTGSFSGSASVALGGSSTPISITPMTVYLNIMIKL